MTDKQLLADVDHRHLDALEEEAIFILREVAASFERPALLFSSGKDSCVVLHLAEKAFKMKNAQGQLEGKLPFPLLHVDTGHNFPEVIEFREKRVAEIGERLIVAHMDRAPGLPARIAQRPPDGDPARSHRRRPL
jgi:sulfate adenylyltransferase subunit 2